MTSKSTLIPALLLIITLRVGAQVRVEVSESVELMSILSRTAGFREYCMDMAGQYTKDTETWFAPYKNHPVIAYYQGLHDNHSISYDAVASMAIHLDINKGKIKFLGEKTNLDHRWQDVDVDDFIGRLNQFYTDTRFHEFFEQQHVFYEAGLRSYQENVMAFFHQEWYARFYGTEASERFHIVIGFTSGGGNYGLSRQLAGQSKEAFAICGYYIDGQTGKAFENGLGLASTLIHEFNHSFVNGLLDIETNQSMLAPLGNKLLKLSCRAMNSQAYRNAKTVINESIVRAAVIIYMQDNGFSAMQVGEEMEDQISRGFNWMPELVTALRNYVRQREQYKTLNDFYPEIARCMNKYVDDETERIKKALK